MQSKGGCGLRDQGDQVVSKERESKELQALRIHELENSLKKAKEECLTLRKNYQQLKEAFQFNLVILDERDRELERYDVIIDKALSVDYHRQEELSWLRIQVAMLEEKRARGAEERLEELSISQHNAAQHKLQLDKLRWIKELEEKVEWMESKLKKEQDDHIKRYEDVVQALKKCDGQLEDQHHAHTEQLQRAEKHIVKLQENIKVLSAQAHSVQKDQKEAVEQKDRIIQRLRTEVETTRTGLAKYINQASSEMVAKDTEIIILQEREAKLRTELDRSREEMERYKQQLSTGLKRERALEQLQVQMELEWQRRCEELKSAQYLANEQLLQDLTQARDQAKAELNEKEQVLQDLTVSLHSVKKERDQAIKGHTPKVDYLASEEIHHLKKQNSILRGVVSQMRKDMEGVCHLLPHAQAKSQASSPQPVQHPVTISNTPTADTEIALGRAQSTEISSKSNPADYTQALEQEVSLLKTRCRLLEGQLEGATGLSSLAQAEDKPAEDLAPIIQDSTHPQNHGLKHGCLCLEKHANITALKRQEFRVAHMESAPINIMEQNMLVQQLQDMNFYLWHQQLASGLMSGGLLKKCQGTRSNPPLLHTRLKQAASHIARLSREKQQLIEMGNCLRAQITTAGLQEPMEPERDSTEKQEDQHDRRSALEQLQYQLTTQSSKNKENTSPISQSQSSLDMRPQPHSPLSRSQLPSEESLQPLKELWEILDHELCSSVYSEGEGEWSSRLVDDPCGAEVQMAVYSIGAPIHSHLQAEIQQWRNPSKTPSVPTKTSRAGAPSRMTKIRNYNVKD